MNVLTCSRPHVVIIDYGAGNLYSVEKALNHVGASTEITGNPNKILKADKLVLPGVGAFGDGMEGLRKNGLIHPIEEYVNSGRPLLGICLGMHLLFTEGEEFGTHGGLDIIKGKVMHLGSLCQNRSLFKFPHVGWNMLFYRHSEHRDEISLRDSLWCDTILESLCEKDFVYFNHSNVVIPEDLSLSLAETEYAGSVFCSVVRNGNVYGCQFHPEKSGKAGLEIFKKFVFDLKVQPEMREAERV